MENPATQHPVFGPWDGIDETGRGGATKVVDALNVVFRNGRAMRRLGRCVVASDPAGRRVAGLHEHVSALGVRSVVAYLEAQGGSAGGLARVNGSSVIDVAVPEDVQPVTPGAASAAANVDGHLVIAEPGGKLLDYDGQAVALLVAKAGLDAAVAVESYLSSPPGASSLAMWRDRLVGAGDPGAPRLIALSENKWAVANIPDDAPIGGPNLWPQRQNFDLATEEGDTVQAITVIYDRLAVFGRAGVAVVDEDAVAPYARIVARQHGCIAPRSVVNVGDRAFYLGEGAVYSFSGTASTVISGPVSRTLDASEVEPGIVDWERAHEAVAVNLRRTREYRIWLPVRGLPGNSLCLVFNYKTETWEKHSHWYPFDSYARWNKAYRFDVTAALAALTASGREVLLTGDSAGRVWMEDVGEDDQGQVAPAFFALSPVDRGAEVETFSDWMVDCLHDGATVGGLAVIDGRNHEQEIVRVLDGELTSSGDDDIPYAVARAVRAGDPQWRNVLAWPLVFSGPRVDELRLGVRQRARKLQPVLLLPGARGDEVDPAPGGIRQLEIGARARPGRR